MLILILVICIGVIGLAIYLEENMYGEFLPVLIGVTGGVVSVVVLSFLIVITCNFVDTSEIPTKIEVLEEQNQKIEAQVNLITENYLEYEGETYEKLTSDNAEVFAIAYPQLASNETVKKQMEVYISNNQKITELKLELCMRDVYAWWLYFGGGE